jgi:hypothetical protein
MVSPPTEFRPIFACTLNKRVPVGHSFLAKSQIQIHTVLSQHPETSNESGWKSALGRFNWGAWVESLFFNSGCR